MWNLNMKLLRPPTWVICVCVCVCAAHLSQTLHRFLYLCTQRAVSEVSECIEAWPWGNVSLGANYVNLRLSYFVCKQRSGAVDRVQCENFLNFISEGWILDGYVEVWNFSESHSEATLLQTKVFTVWQIPPTQPRFSVYSCYVFSDCMWCAVSLC